MLGWFRKKPVPLTGAPTVRRQKTYSAQSGYVYQYFYEGNRRASTPPGTEYVFDVSADRKSSAPVSVFVSDESIASWERQSGRALSGTERYALAKMALFQAFDERKDPAAVREPIRVQAEDVPAILANLNID
jgi:hypothetical protein